MKRLILLVVAALFASVGYAQTVKFTVPDVEVKVTFTESHIMVSFDSIRVYATLLTGEFIDYQKILPKAWTTEVAIPHISIWL